MLPYPRRLLAGLILTVALVACGSSGVQGSRPTTPAILQIISPTPNEVTGTTVDLTMKLTNAVVVSPAQVGGKINPTQGHIHVSLDGKLISMLYGTQQVIPGLTPGTHTLQASFVASDHLPFANEVVAAVIFTVK
jgi:hypothetical protein